MLQDIVDNSFEAAKKQKAAQGGYITLERGIATIPLLVSMCLSIHDTSGLACCHSVLVSGKSCC